MSCSLGQVRFEGFDGRRLEAVYGDVDIQGFQSSQRLDCNTRGAGRADQQHVEFAIAPSDAGKLGELSDGGKAPCQGAEPWGQVSHVGIVDELPGQGKEFRPGGNYGQPHRAALLGLGTAQQAGRFRA